MVELESLETLSKALVYSGAGALVAVPLTAVVDAFTDAVVDDAVDDVAALQTATARQADRRPSRVRAELLLTLAIVT